MAETEVMDREAGGSGLSGGIDQAVLIQLLAKMQTQQLQIVALLAKQRGGAVDIRDGSDDGDDEGLEQAENLRSRRKKLQTLQMSKNAVILGDDPKFAEFEQWRKSWLIQVSVKRVAEYPRDEQVNFIREHMSPGFRDILDEQITVIANEQDEPTTEELIASIGNYIKDNGNLMVTRQELMKRKQEMGETAEQFLTALKLLAKQANSCKTCLDTQLCTLLTLGLQDDELRRKILEKRPEPTLADVRAICNAYEKSHVANDVANASINVAGSLKTENSNKYRRRNKSRERKRHTRVRSDSESSDEQEEERTCYHCGGSWHEKLSDCPAMGRTCNQCGGKNHFGNVCNNVDKTKNISLVKKAFGVRRKMKKMFDTKMVCRATAWDRTAMVKVDQEGIKTVLKANPDTGAEVNILPRKLLYKLGLKVSDLNPSDINLLSFTGRKHKPDGFIYVQLSIHGVAKVSKLYVDSEVVEFLLCGQDAESLGIVEFPLHSINSAKEAKSEMKEQTTRDRLLKEFADIFNDTPEPFEVAEVAVRVAKHLVKITTSKGGMDRDDFVKGILELRNNGKSPAELIKSNSKIDKEHNCNPPLPCLPVGTRVWIQNAITKEWDDSGIITNVIGRNYQIRLDGSGRLWWRNYRHLRKNSTVHPEKMTERPVLNKYEHGSNHPRGRPPEWRCQ